jgi:hypothetical protein
LILNVPVFWVQNPVHVSACLVTAVGMHFVAPLAERRLKLRASKYKLERGDFSVKRRRS